MTNVKSIRVLIISTDSSLIDRIGGALTSYSPEVVAADGYVSAFRQLESHDFDFIFADSALTDGPLREILARLNFRDPGAEIILILEAQSREIPDSPFELGSAAILSPDIESDDIEHVVGQLLHGRRNMASCGWLGKAPAIRTLSSMVLTAAATDATVLLVGESGTGKELAAKAIHQNSPRKNKPFIAINCSAIPEGVLESELFGHEKGAFTHAFAQKQGVFESAHGGTIFLDEIGDMPLSLQAKLLRVLEERQVRRVGGTVTLDIDIRVIGATNHDLSTAVQEGSFRHDLYYRLSVIRLLMPRLLDRLWDIPLLVTHFVAGQKKQLTFTDGAFERLLSYHWPGNVRELRNFVVRVSVLADSARIDQETVQRFLEGQSRLDRNLPVVTGQTPEASRHDLILAALAELKRDLTEIKQAIGADGRRSPVIDGREAVPHVEEEKPRNLKHLEIVAIRDALEKVSGNRRKAAKLLGIGERTLYRKIREYGL